MTRRQFFDYIEAKLDFVEFVRLLLVQLNNSFEREALLEALQTILKENKDLISSLSLGHEELADSLLFYQQQREEKHARAGRLKRLFSFFTSEEDVEEEAFKKALRDTERMRKTISLSQDSTVTGLTQTHNHLITSLQTLLFRLIDESEEGKEMSKELLEKLVNRLLEKEVA